MKIIDKTELVELFENNLVEDSVYTCLRNEGLKNVYSIISKTDDYYYHNSFGMSVRNFVYSLREVVEFTKQFEDGLVISDATINLPASVIFTIRSVYQKEKKRFNAEYILNTIFNDYSDIFVASFFYTLVIEPEKILKEDILRNRFMQDPLISKNIDLEIERYKYVLVSIVTKISDSLNNFPDSILYKRLVDLSVKKMGIRQKSVIDAEEYASLLDFQISRSKAGTGSSPDFIDLLQKEFEKLQKKKSSRLRNVVAREFPTYKDIMPWVEGVETDFKLRNCGMKTKTELKDLIKSFSEFYSSYKESPSFKENKKAADVVILETVAFLLRNEFQKNNSDNSCVLEISKNIYPKIESLSNDIVNDPAIIYTKICQYDLHSALGCIDLLIQVCTKISIAIRHHKNYLDYAEIFKNAIVAITEQRNKNLRVLVHYKCMTADKETLLRQEFKKMLSKCSVKCQNVITRNNIGYMELLGFRGRENEFRNINNIGRRGEEELKNLLDVFENKYNIILNNDSKEARFLKCKNYFPFLSENDLIFVDYFFVNNNHYPMFYILCRYFETTNNINCRIFASYSGLGNDALYDLNKIADYYCHSRERIRQIVAKRTFADNNFRMVMEREWWSTYNLSLDGVITQSAVIFNKISNEEKLNISFYGFSCLLTLLLDAYVINVLEPLKCLNQTEIGVNMSLGIPFKTFIFSAEYSGFRFAPAFSEINRLVRLQRDTSLKIPIQYYFITNPEYWSEGKALEERKTKTFLDIFETILHDCSSVVIENHNIVLNANKINYSDVFYDILQERGESMHINDIFDIFIKLYPDSKYVDAKQIKPYLFRDIRIKCIGRSSMFTLVEWNDYTGTLFDLAVDLVSESDTPIELAELIHKMLLYRPTSTERSVQSMINMCINNGRLTPFYGDLVGIPNKKYDERYVLQPKGFKEWLDAFRVFVINNNCFPVSESKGYEGSLYNWYNDARSLISLSSEEILCFNSLMKDLEQIPHTRSEKKFLDNCNLLKDFYLRKGRIVTLDEDKTLYNWFQKNLRRYNDYNDNRKTYFRDFLSFISTPNGCSEE